MARVFEKYVVPDSDPILNKPTEIKEKPDKPVDVTKTLRFHHNALRMEDLIQSSPKEAVETQEEETDPDVALMKPMFWLMKGLRGMMQIASGK